MGRPSHEITELLRAWDDGNQEALAKLIPLVHHELKRLARYYMARERLGHTLQTTALINEAYLRLVDLTAAKWQDRAHFFAVCSKLMRQILTDHARSRRYQKRGGEPSVSPSTRLWPYRETYRPIWQRWMMP